MKEALTLALETLESSRVFVMSREMIKQPEGADWYDNRITAIKEVLAQPPQRPWVGLTDEEMESTCAGTWSYDPHVIARAIEAKLKDKNT